MKYLILISVACLLGGIVSLTQVTLGVGLIGAACYLGIMARVTQANDEFNRQAARRELERAKAVIDANRPLP